MKRKNKTKALVTGLLIFSLLLGNAINVAAASLNEDSSSEIISLQEYMEAVSNEYLKYNVTCKLTNPDQPSDMLVITRETLNKRLEMIREERESYQPNIEIGGSENASINHIAPRNMPFTRVETFSRGVSPNVYGYMDLQFTVTYTGNAQYGKLTGVKSVDLRQVRSYNLKSWTYDGYHWGFLNNNKTIQIAASGTAVFEYKDPLIGVTQTYWDYPYFTMKVNY